MLHAAPFLRAGDRVLFQGDSITNAFRKPEEVNNAYQLGAGYAFLAASRISAERPADGIEFLNRGVSGNGLAQLGARWDEDCTALRPTVLSLLVGINETMAWAKGTGQTPESFVRHYDALLTRTAAALPGVRFILCEPFALACGIFKQEWFDDLRARQAGVRDVATRFGARFVPLQDMFDAACASAPAEHWIYDGIHPTAAGGWLIAQRWLEQMCGQEAEFVLDL